MFIRKILFVVVLLLGVQFASAEALGPIVLTPLSTHYEVHWNSGIYEALVFLNDPDVWTIDLSAFSGNVDVTLTVNDWYPPLPDDYDVSWAAVYLGNTLTASPGRTFNFTTSAGIHELTVDYVNLHTGPAPHPGGSGYNMWLDVSGASVPEPTSLMLFLPAAMMMYRRRMSS